MSGQQITTRRELAEVLATLTHETREMRLLDANPPRSIALMPHLERLLTGDVLSDDDPIWTTHLNPEGTGPTLAEATADDLLALRDEHGEWTRRYRAALERTEEATAMLGELGTGRTLGDLWESLPDDGTPDTVLRDVP